jgi:hypothetical protein
VALLAPQQITSATGGTTITYSTVTATDTVVPDDRSFIVWKNTNAGANTVGVVVPGSDYGVARPDVAITVPATTGERWYGPMVGDLADPTTGLISVTNSQTGAGSTCALVRI